MPSPFVLRHRGAPFWGLMQVDLVSFFVLVYTHLERV